ncbi:MAG: phosphoribosylformylglycinamidine synthase subunit PurS [Planctomycetales bacterium]|nr:phosphoribosylformylglycinamidine synthase subunit PurS [bacterium]UNM08998.1 MAG: phosphoribosylformylglycinamidine synthase subunit PurS [Planctomycetales bacterium]
MQFACEIIISPRSDILDPEGDAIGRSLARLNFSGASEVRVGKYMTLQVEADSAEQARERVGEMCKALLVNPITEDYEVSVNQL